MDGGYKTVNCNNCRLKHSCSRIITEICVFYDPIEEDNDSKGEVSVKRNKIEIHRLICVDLNKTYEVKNERYGDSFKKLLEEYGDVAFLIRIGDKFERIKTLLKNPSLNDQQDESVYDTIKDLANYCLMYLVENSIKKDLEAGNK
jgi:hypothetical protein